MADNVATDDSESELQFVSTKSERLKLSWPIRGWSERTSPARTRRSVTQWQSAELMMRVCDVRYQFMEENSVSMVQWRLEVSPCDKDVQVIVPRHASCDNVTF